ncbi:MAG: VCBS repeat-containing protein, partial [Bifidobacteriaceae bacterium]|nr:VCBS repeat-containing protein [Bifidobacteriaceae bacterium]
YRLDTNYLLASGLKGHRAYGVGDWDRDSFGDVITVDPAGVMYLRRGQGAGKLAAPVQIGWGWSSYRAVPIGDITGDGWPDLLGIDQSGILWTYSGNGASGFKAGRIRSGSGWSTSLTPLAGGDTTGDGRRDLLMIDGSGKLWCYPGNGHAGFGSRSLVNSGWNGWMAVTGADLNGDGRGDLMGRQNSTHRLYYYRNTGNNRFAAGQAIGSGW